MTLWTHQGLTGPIFLRVPSLTATMKLSFYPAVMARHCRLCGRPGPQQATLKDRPAMEGAQVHGVLEGTLALTW